MDPITIVGAVASSVQIAQFIGNTIQALSSLKGKYRDADATIRSLIGQLSTIRAAIVQVRDWAEFNSEETPKEKSFLTGLHIALDGCQAVMDALSDEIQDLMAGAELTDGATLGIRVKVKAIWNENSMKSHQDRLLGQVQALQFLLIATQCRDASSQSRLLGSKENHMLITRIAKDTRSIRESRSSVSSQAGDSVDASGGLIFHREEKFLTAEVAGLVPTPNRRSPTFLMQPIPKDEVSETEDSPSTNMPEIALSERSSTDANRTKSAQVIPAFQPDTTSQYRRDYSLTMDGRKGLGIQNLQLVSTMKSPEKAKPATSTGRKFWSSLSRLKLVSISKDSLLDPRIRPSGVRSMKDMKQNYKLGSNTQSIDIISVDGSETPTLVRAAQAGNKRIIEAMLANETDIETRHGPSSRTALSVAAHCGNTEIVMLLLQNNADPDTRDSEGSSPLQLASSRNHLEVIEALLREGSDLEASNERQETPLWISAHQGHYEAASLLLCHGARANTRARHQWSPLHAAAKRGCARMIELLLLFNAHIEARDSNSMTALHHACEKGDYQSVEMLVKKGADTEAHGQNSISPLLCAASHGHRKIVELLLARKLTYSFKKSKKSLEARASMALLCASVNGHLEVVEYLLDGKSSVLVTDSRGLSPLHLAVIGAHFQVVDYLLTKKAPVNSLCKEGQTPLHYSCQCRNADIVSRLLNAGASPGLIAPSSGKLPIHSAAANGSVEIIDLLHKAGSDLNSSDSAGERPLCIACREGHLKIVERLLELGIPLHSAFKNSTQKDSPLCIAARSGHLDIVRYLVKSGSSIEQRDENGHIPLRHAAYFGHPEVLEYLLLEGAGLIDDGEIPYSWGFVLVPDLIGFSNSDGISEDRKQRVRDLLADAVRIVGGGFKNEILPIQIFQKSELYRRQSSEIRDGKKRAY